MPAKTYRIVHYLNQFFGGIGGEEKAYVGPQIKEGPVGPGKALEEVLGERGEVVATVICGDNYFTERVGEATSEVKRLLDPYEPHAVIAGPAFEAGRYGIACGAVCQAVQSQKGIPAVTGMYEENPGVDLYRKEVYIIQTSDTAREMRAALSKMIDLACRLIDKKPVGKPSEEGYFPKGILANEMLEKKAAERVVDILLAKLHGRPFHSEISLPKYDRIRPAPPIMEISKAKIALVTDGGLVPRGNPDGIEVRKATRFGAYDIKGTDALDPQNYEVVHVGYDTSFIAQAPHRLVPVDVMRDLEKEGALGKLHETFYATSGTANVVEYVEKMGQAIGNQLKDQRVSGVVLTST